MTIVHTKRLLGRATVAVYVDGQEIHNTQLQYPMPKVSWSLTINKDLLSLQLSLRKNDVAFCKPVASLTAFHLRLYHKDKEV